MTWVPRRTVVVVASVLVVAAPVAAHEGHAANDLSGLGGLPPLMFLISSFVVATAFYLDHQRVIDGRWADVGVLLGVLGVLVSIVLLM